MVYVFLSLAAFLIVVAVVHWRDRKRDMAVVFLAFSILNIAAAAKAILTRDDYAYRLHPQDEKPLDDPDWGMPDRR